LGSAAVAYSPSGSGGFCELLLSLFTDKLDLSLRVIFWDTGMDGCLRGCSDVGLTPGVWPPFSPFGAKLAPQVHMGGTMVCSAGALASSAPGWASWSLGLCLEVLTVL
jgi:hypothetical protein